MLVLNFADILDIALVAVLLYALLVWFKRARAAFVARGMLVITGVYLVARATGMLMTTMLFQGFFAILLIALIVIFQEELRSIFERIAVWSLRGGTAPASSTREIDIVARTMGDLARERIGALVVLRGLDPLDRHIEGGWELNGDLSEALLKSIFDPSSMGHDGALILEGPSVSRFGCHLPLSRDTEKVGTMGTRHTAALGLSERTDALCLVVSEERGAISVARDGKLHGVERISALGRIIEGFYKEKAPRTDKGVIDGLFKRNTREKALALGSSVVLWGFIAFGTKIWTKGYQVPVQARNVPPGLEVAAVSPPEVHATLTGLLRDFYWVDKTRLALRLDLSASAEGVNRLRVDGRDVARPAGLSVEELDPRGVEVVLVRRGKGSP